MLDDTVLKDLGEDLSSLEESIITRISLVLTVQLTSTVNSECSQWPCIVFL